MPLIVCVIDSSGKSISAFSVFGNDLFLALLQVVEVRDSYAGIMLLLLSRYGIRMATLRSCHMIR